MRSIVETPEYLDDCKAAGITDAERSDIVLSLAINPKAGVLIPGTGGARKVRFPGQGKGKSGGYRVISYYGGDDIPLFLLAVFAKGDKIDLTKAEQNQLRIELAKLADDYRKGMKRHVKSG
jgi:hypothetical protein